MYSLATSFIFQGRATFKTSSIIFCFSIRPSQLERVEIQKKSVEICVMTSCKLTDLEIFRCIKSLMDCPLQNFGWTPFRKKNFTSYDKYGLNPDNFCLFPKEWFPLLIFIIPERIFRSDDFYYAVFNGCCYDFFSKLFRYVFVGDKMELFFSGNFYSTKLWKFFVKFICDIFFPASYEKEKLSISHRLWNVF